MIGKITKPHGIKGAFKIYPLTDDPDRFAKLSNVVLVGPGGERRSCSIISVQRQNRMVILRCREMGLPVEIAPFIGGTIEIPEEEAINLPEGSYFQHDLVGMAVTLENGESLGEIREIWNAGKNDLLVIRNKDREILIPAVESMIVKVDMKNRRITIRPVEGLLDLN